MVQKTRIVLTDDLAGDDTPADETVTFALDGTSYEIDLTSENADTLRGILFDYAAKARKVSGTRGRGRASGARKTGDGPSAAEVRTWAKENGHDVPGRGRIPQPVRDQYDAAH